MRATPVAIVARAAAASGASDTRLNAKAIPSGIQRPDTNAGEEEPERTDQQARRLPRDEDADDHRDE